MHRWDVIVIGTGAVGSAALRAAAEAGARVLGIEQFTPANLRGSSHGHSRIFRHAYFEHATSFLFSRLKSPGGAFSSEIGARTIKSYVIAIREDVDYFDVETRYLEMRQSGEEKRCLDGSIAPSA